MKTKAILLTGLLGISILGMFAQSDVPDGPAYYAPIFDLSEELTLVNINFHPLDVYWSSGDQVLGGSIIAHALINSKVLIELEGRKGYVDQINASYTSEEAYTVNDEATFTSFGAGVFVALSSSVKEESRQVTLKERVAYRTKLVTSVPYNKLTSFGARAGFQYQYGYFADTRGLLEGTQVPTSDGYLAPVTFQEAPGTMYAFRQLHLGGGMMMSGNAGYIFKDYGKRFFRTLTMFYADVLIGFGHQYENVLVNENAQLGVGQGFNSADTYYGSDDIYVEYEFQSLSPFAGTGIRAGAMGSGAFGGLLSSYKLEAGLSPGLSRNAYILFSVGIGLNVAKSQAEFYKKERNKEPEWTPGG